MNNIQHDHQVVTLSPEQEHALRKMLQGHNVFLSGLAGSGKSVVIREFKRRSPKNVVVVASTGAAALLVNGTTAHSFFSMPIGVLTSDSGNSINPQQADIIRNTDCFVFEECSMTRSDLMIAVDALLRRLTFKHEKFMGGKQIIMVGDFLQLPSFAKEDQVQDYITNEYGGLQIYQTELWKSGNFVNFYLTTVFRQKDQRYLNILNGIRTGETLYPTNMLAAESYHGGDIWVDTFGSHLDDLNSVCYRPGASIDYDAIRLCCVNRQADAINQQALKQIHGPGVIFNGIVSGKFPEDEIPISRYLRLKPGAKVMLRANKYGPDGRLEYVNGDIATVVSCSNINSPRVEVKLMNGRIVNVGQSVWSHFEYKLQTNEEGRYVITQVEVGKYFQVPVSLAWATSIHKAQGLSIPKIHLVLGGNGCFCSGQLYTALSRVPSMRNLTLDRPITEQDVITDRHAIEFYENLNTHNVQQI